MKQSLKVPLLSPEEPIQVVPLTSSSSLNDLPNFSGVVIKRPSNYRQRPITNTFVELDEYTIHAYQYASTTKPGFCEPAAIIYAADEVDIQKAIRYCVANDVALAIRSSGHQYEGFSSTSGKNIQLDMKNFNSFEFDSTTGIITAGVAVNLGRFDDEAIKIDCFVPHGQCGTVCLGGHMQTGGFSVLCGRSFGMFCDYIISFRLINAKGDLIVVHKPSLETKDIPMNDELWFAVIGGSPGSFGIVIDMKIKPLRISDYPNMRCSTTYMHFSPKSYQALLDIVAECNDNDELAADFNVCAFFLAKSDPILRPNLDTIMKNKHPEVYGPNLPPHPSIVGLWVTWCNLEGGEITDEAKQFFDKIEKKTKPYVSKLETLGLQIMQGVFGKVMAMHTPDKPLTMASLLKDFCFDARVHANPYVSGTWCGDSQQLSKNGFSEWATKVTTEACRPGCYTDFEWVVSGGKYSKNMINSRINPGSVAWRDVKLLAFLYIHYDNTDYSGNPWTEPKEYATNLVQRMQNEAIGSAGKLASKLRLWKAFPASGAELDRDRSFYFNSEEDYQRILKVKDWIDPNNVFTPNLFTIGSSRMLRKQQQKQQQQQQQQREGESIVVDADNYDLYDFITRFLSCCV